MLPAVSLRDLGRHHTLKTIPFVANQKGVGNPKVPEASAGTMATLESVITKTVHSKSLAGSAMGNTRPSNVLTLPARNPAHQSRNAINTPINVKVLSVFLSGFPPKAASALLHGFTEGFALNYQGSHESRESANHKSALSMPEFVSKKLQSELSLGRIAGPFRHPPFSDFVVSPLGLVPKKVEGEFRLIFDLSFPKGESINSGIMSEHTKVQYENFDYALSLVKQIGRGCLMAKCDIESAFRIIPIASADYGLLGFKWEGVYYHDKCLPMGCSVSCNIFESFSSALQWVMQHKFGVYSMTHILDDFIFFGPPSSAICGTDLNNFLSLASKINIPMNHSKTVLPTTCAELHGIEVDTINMVARLPKDKVDRALTLVSQLHARDTVKLRDLQSLIGLLNFTCKVIVPGRTFLRRLIDLTMGLNNPNHHRRLNKAAKQDLLAWQLFLRNFNGTSMLLSEKWLSSNQIKLYTDAATSAGYAAVYGGQWFNGTWPPLWQTYHINILELYPVVAALELWGPLLKNSCIMFICDNLSVVHVINNMTSKDSIMMQLLRRLVVAAMTYNVNLRAQHIPGERNILADALSRFQLDRARQAAPWLNQHPQLLPGHLLPWITWPLD